MSTAPEPRLISDRMTHWAQTTPEAEALHYGGDTITWAQLTRRVAGNAGALANLGVKRGDVVASRMTPGGRP